MKKIEELLTMELNVLNIGIEIFADELKAQGIETLQVDWKPPARGNESLLKILNEIRET